MDAGEVFVLILTAFAVGILAYIELKSRRSRRASQPSPLETDPPDKTRRSTT